MRTIVEFHVGKARLIGTQHVPPEPGAATSAAPAAGSTAVVLLNFAQASRAGIGDLSAGIADQLAQQGHPVYRVDMPGLGDSSGPAPAFGEPLWYFIRDGGHVPYASAVVRRVRDVPGIRHVVLGGLCAGAVTAIYTAAEQQALIDGVLLLEPVFHRCQEKPKQNPLRGRPGGNGAPSGPPRLPGAHVLDRAREHVDALPPRHWARRLYAGAKLVRDGLRRPGMRIDANRPLLRAWNALVRSPTRILLVNSGVGGRAMHNLYYLGLRFPERVDWRVVPETNHLMAANGGRASVIRHVSAWMARRFVH